MIKNQFTPKDYSDNMKNWTAPRSPFGLLQEQIYDNPWKVFVCCIFCNLTKRVQAEPYFWKVIQKWHNPKSLANADVFELQELIKPLGLSQRRATALKRMSYDFIHKNWKDDPTSLYGIGKYGSDAYWIFCRGRWKDIEPKDGALINYRNFLLEHNFTCTFE